MKIKSINIYSGVNANFKGKHINVESVKQKENTQSKTDIISGTEALAVASIGSIPIIQKSKTPDINTYLGDFNAKYNAIISLIKNKQTQMNQTMQNMQKMFSEIGTQGNTGSKKITSHGRQKIIEELDENGKISRRLTFIDNSLKTIQENYEEISRDSWKADREINFENGKPILYREGYEVFAGDFWKADREINFENGKPILYREGYKEAIDGSWKVAREINFENGKPILYKENCEERADGSCKRGKQLDFKNGKPNWYEENYIRLANGSWKREEEVGFKDGEPNSYKKESESVTGGAKNVFKEYRLTDKGWQEVTH